MRSVALTLSTTDLVAQSEAARYVGAAALADDLLLAAWLSYDEAVDAADETGAVRAARTQDLAA